MARASEQGSALPALVTLAIALVFAPWAAYGFSGAEIIRRLPLLRPGLVAIGLIYTLRRLPLGQRRAWYLIGGAIRFRDLVSPRSRSPSASRT